MKRSKFILLAFVAALVLMGAAYAAWTQTFRINSTVETGELFVKVVNTNNEVMVDNGRDGYKVVDPEDAGINFSVDPRSVSNSNGTQSTLSEISYNIGNLYPGTKIVSEFSFTNLGSINVSTTANGSVGTANYPLWDALIIKVDNIEVDGDSAGEKISNLAETIRSKVGELKTTDSPKTVTITQELPYDSGNTVEKQELNWSVILTFTQSGN